MIRIDVNVVGEEAILHLESLPRRLRDYLTQRMEAFFEGPATDRLLSELPGKYLDPRYIHSEVATVGSLLIGTLTADQKPGFYPISPVRARVLKFVSRTGEIVFTRRVTRHPFLNASPVIERYFRENKPWLIEGVEDFVFDAIYNAR
jgi:hypothetical protein